MIEYKLSPRPVVVQLLKALSSHPAQLASFWGFSKNEADQILGGFTLIQYKPSDGCSPSKASL
jgi:hypothetical protein